MSSQLVVVGGGRIGSALVEGLLSAKWADPSSILIVESAAEQRDALRSRFAGVAVAPSLELDDVDERTGAVVCVKPDHAEGAARLLAACGISRVLSVVAGLSTQRIEAAFSSPVAVVRSMPNTPVVIRQGVSAIAGGSHVTAADLEWAESILGAVGTVVRVSERHLDAVTGLSGSGPAYVFLAAEAMIEAGVHQGLTRDVSRQLVVGTFLGAAALLVESGASPEELRAEVTSPGGTTAAGLRMLEARAVRAAYLEAVAAAAERSRQLGR
jgi:pyrroline-5-carboxylate reductase